MLELTQAEQDALRIVVLVCTLQKEVYGASHQMNWKKTGLSRAYYRQARVLSSSMPTRRAAAAYDFLMKNNKYYALFAAQQGRLLDEQLPLNISSYDLFTQTRGIECAMFPHLYPTTDFTDTGILQHYQDSSEDDTNRVCSIGLSWTRKVLSSVRAYGEQRDLPFFLNERQLPGKFFNAQVRAKSMNLTADVLMRDSQASSGYWDTVQDSLGDLVRIMLSRCYDKENHPQLYSHVRNLRGQVWLCAFPNVFITVTAAEWKFPRPYFMQAYHDCVFAGAYIMALHMYYLVRCMWLFLANKFGHRFFIVLEWVMKTEYQGRGTPHWHIAAWVVSFQLLNFLAGRTGTAVVSVFVKFLEVLFNCMIDVQVGNGRLNYISGYVSKDHDADDA